MGARSAGLLLHPSSLPGRFGIGDLGKKAITFLEWAASAGQTLWQVLPLGPTTVGNSPYVGVSAFAGNPLLISPERLVEEGLLPGLALEGVPEFPADRVDFGRVIVWKKNLLRSSFDFFKRAAPKKTRDEFGAFVADAEHAGWLEDWTLFSALKAKLGGREWTDWDSGLKHREAAALAAARRKFADEIHYRRYLQFVFFRQWKHVKREANKRGIQIMGDIPIYVGRDSADVWAHRHLFSVDEEGRPEAVAGVPPDYFSPTGQLWGNPLYRWDRMENENFSWWIGRIRANLKLFDLVRLDHFRGFAGYWEVSAGSATAENGKWVPGPGGKLFAAVKKALGEQPLIAEDLGLITQDVRDLLATLALPGMAVLQFGFDELDHPFMPHRHARNSLVYTGTHDNDTTRGWFSGLAKKSKRRLLDYVGTDGSEIEWDLIRCAYTSVADRVLVPVQDVFGLGSEARMNTPGKEDSNWAWRALPEQFVSETAARLRRLGELTGRIAAS